jgi:UPF0755 protein
MENPLLPEEKLEYKDENFEILLRYKKAIFYALGVIIFLSLFYFFLLSAPSDFPSGAIERIDPGMSLRDISFVLKKDEIIRSRVAFEFFITILGGEKHIISADYLFENKVPVWQVALRIAGGLHRMAPVSVTIPEGFNLNQIGDTFASRLINFNETQFLVKAKPLEGYLFPDTYFFLSDANEDNVIKSMNSNFEKKIIPILPEITQAGKNEQDVIIMASIIEREAKGDADRGIISGILWKRIKIGMPLEIDSAPETYKTKGLPENPVGNPGLKAIEAAINPQTSPYLYYLHDKNGNIHYAETFAEHEANIKKYLK